MSRQVKWQLVGRTALPPAPLTLAALGVKERLQARWAEVHGEEAEGQGGPGAGLPHQRASSGSGEQAGCMDGSKGRSVPASEGGFVSPRQRLFFASLNRSESAGCQGAPGK